MFVEVHIVGSYCNGNTYQVSLSLPTKADERKSRHRGSEVTMDESRSLTSVAHSLTLDLSCHTCALFHVTEMNPSPGLSDVIITQVYGFIAFLCKDTKRHIKGNSLKREERRMRASRQSVTKQHLGDALNGV